MLFSHLAPTLGVYGESREAGFLVSEVEQGSAAAKAGLQAGDMITHVEGAPVRDAISLRLMYWVAGMDGKAGLTVQRGSETLSVDVVPAEGAPTHRQGSDVGPPPANPVSAVW